MFVLFFFLAAVFQSGFISNLAVFGCKPDFLLALSVFIGFYIGGTSIPMFCAATAGIFAGMFSAAPFAFYCVMYCTACAVGILCRHRRFSQLKMAPLIVIALGTLSSIIFYFLYFLLSSGVSFLPYFFKTAFLYLLLNAVIAFPVAALVRVFSVERSKIFVAR